LGEHPETAMRIKSFIRNFLTFTRIFWDFAMNRRKHYRLNSDLRETPPIYCGTPEDFRKSLESDEHRSKIKAIKETINAKSNFNGK